MFHEVRNFSKVTELSTIISFIVKGQNFICEFLQGFTH